METFVKTTIGVLVVAILMGTSIASASDWTQITSEPELNRIFTDTVHTAELKPGVKATSTYKADGTGELDAWGKKFDRKWKIEDGEACILISGDWSCFTIERDGETSAYRATNTESRERVVLKIEGGGVVVPGADAGQGGGDASPSADEVAKELANPNTPLATITLKTQYRSFKGSLPNADDQTSLTFLLQPTFPFPVGEGGVVFFRPGIPVIVDSPVFDASEADFDTESGLGDIGFDLGFGSTNKKTGFLLAGGLASTIPTHTKDDLGNDKWRMGPELLVGLLRPEWVIGAFPNHQWSVVGGGDNTSVTTLQVFGITLPGSGYSVGTAPIITYDWESQDFTVPLNLDIGKTIIINGRPWKLGLELNYYIEQPGSFGPKLMIGINVGPVVENVFAQLFR
jgi:hypothetical protein